MAILIALMWEIGDDIGVLSIQTVFGAMAARKGCSSTLGEHDVSLPANLAGSWSCRILAYRISRLGFLEAIFLGSFCHILCSLLYGT